ncbi:MAG: Dyp-type peroxidase [Solirubrobacteraceae bacterium]
MAAPIDLADIQGDVLRAHGSRYTRTSYVFVGIGDGARGRAWLGDVADRVTSALPWRGARPPSTTNVALTASGLRALGVSEEAVGSFATEFRQGMAARAALLGDAGDSDPAAWEEGLGTGAAHVLVTINALSEEALEAELALLRDGLGDSGELRIVHELHARSLQGAREHFGFADGSSQPAIEGVEGQRVRGGGVPEKNGGWRPLALGEFVLGYEDEDSRLDSRRRLPSAPNDPLGRSGTYMVWRKLHQHVAHFRKTLRDASSLYAEGDESLLAAKIVGRWRNGSPLMNFPARPPERFYATASDANDFRYASADPGGGRCPLGAHIRRSNPRDALGFDGKLTFRHRIIRRGMPYGAELPDGALEDDGAERGLAFVCFNASIARQFESVQRQWLNDGNAFHLGDDRDFLLGGNRMIIQGDRPFLLSSPLPFVTTRGGEYLFVPGITALAAIADGVAG